MGPHMCTVPFGTMGQPCRAPTGDAWHASQHSIWYFVLLVITCPSLFPPKTHVTQPALRHASPRFVVEEGLGAGGGENREGGGVGAGSRTHCRSVVSDASGLGVHMPAAKKAGKSGTQDGDPGQNMT